jgi:hypothetical protein
LLIVAEENTNLLSLVKLVGMVTVREIAYSSLNLAAFTINKTLYEEAKTGERNIPIPDRVNFSRKIFNF